MFHGEGSRHVNGMMQYLCNMYERESVWHGHTAIASEDIYQEWRVARSRFSYEPNC